ncbi:MAG: ATP-dependent zinc metalloprotease FtsH [Lachnospiraceae bacterium]|nr:ATP-dependent zinc metalloprotease FtsH [Lachnospiraceae bacterium]MBQ6196123.1 ATP-dependent zinc metalloprotease FtsH [Lachnospiraceae bacterium]
MIMFLLVLSVVFYAIAFSGNRNSKEVYLSEFIDCLEKNTVNTVTIRQNTDVPTGVVYFNIDSDKTNYYFYTADTVQIQNMLVQYQNNGAKLKWTFTDVQSKTDVWTIISIVLTIGVMIFVVIMITRANGGGANAQMMNFGKSRAQLVKGSKTTFKDVAGLQEEKEDLEEIVDFLKDPKKYTNLGARIPKGILLVGPPGTGKTLLAKAIAGEAGVPFFSISGSDFVEMFVGVGASRVRDLFEEAKKNAPCIVFIDEIDAVARQRGAGLGGSHDEREQTLNQLLVEMDGFGVNSGIIVMAATNRVDILDPAILRPGRFDRKIGVSRPDVKGREAILKVHARNKPLGDDVDLQRVAQTTAGFSGADLENLLNEAAIIAAKENRTYLVQADLDKAFIKVGIGGEKKSHIISDKEKRITAYHESGHAILFHVLPHVGPVHTISVIPTGMGAAGYTMPLPEKDEMFNTKTEILEQIMVDLGGRIAEELTFGDITTGASQDIKNATARAKAMVMKYGMSENIGMIDYGGDGEVFIGRDYGHTREYGEQTASLIDKEIRGIVDDCYAKAKELLVKYHDALAAVAESLIKKEKLDQFEFEKVFNETMGTAPAAE